MTRKASPAPAPDDAAVLAAGIPTAQEAPRGEFFPALPLGYLVESEMNTRRHYDQAALKDLTESVRAKGVLTPLLARQLPTANRYEIAAGSRRFRAARAAGLAAVPVMVRPMTDAEFLEVIVIENLQRSDVHPLEEAEGYRQLHEQYGYSVEALAEKVGKSKAYVYACMKLCALPEAARKLFFENKLNRSTALLVARIPDPNLAEKAARKIIKPASWSDAPMSYRDAVEHVQAHYMLRLDGAPWPKADAQLVPAAGACGPCPKRTGNAPDLFGDVNGADVCTDPACFAKKGEAWNARRLAEAQESGSEVLGKDEAARLFERYDGVTLKRDAAYVDAAELCDADPKWKPGRTTARSWGKVLGANIPKTVVALDRQGKVRELIPHADAVKALGAAGIKLDRFGRNDLTGRNARERQVHDAALVEIVAKAEKDGTIAVWRWIVAGMTAHVWSDLKKRVAGRRGLEADARKDVDKTIDRLIETMDLGRMRGLLAEFVAGRGYPQEYSGGLGKELRAGAKLLGVNLAAIERRIRKERAQKNRAMAIAATKKKARR